MNQRLIASVDEPPVYNGIYSTSFLFSTVMAVSLFIIVVIAAMNLSAIIKIPGGMERETTLLFYAMAFAFFLSIMTVPIRGTIFSQNDLYILSLTQGVEAIVRVLVVVLFFLIFTPSLLYVSAGIIISAILGLILLFTIAYMIRPSLRFSISSINFSVARGMLNTGGGVLITQLGTLLLLNTDLLIMNIIYGPHIAGTYAVVAQWAVVLRGLGLSVAGVFTARVMRAYYICSTEDLIAEICRSIRLLTAFAALPAGFIIGVAPSLLTVWLGPEIAEAWLILVVLALPVALNLVANPLIAVTLAADRTYCVGVCQIVAGIAFIGTAFGLAELLEWGGVEVSVALGLALLLKNWVFLIPFTGRLIGGDAIGRFYIASFLSILWVGGAAILAYMLSNLLVPTSYFELVEVGLLMMPPYMLLVVLTIPIEDTRIVRGEILSIFNWIRRQYEPELHSN